MRGTLAGLPHASRPRPLVESAEARFLTILRTRRSAVRGPLAGSDGVPRRAWPYRLHVRFAPMACQRCVCTISCLLVRPSVKSAEGTLPLLKQPVPPPAEPPVLLGSTGKQGMSTWSLADREVGQPRPSILHADPPKEPTPSRRHQDGAVVVRWVDDWCVRFAARERAEW